MVNTSLIETTSVTAAMRREFETVLPSLPLVEAAVLIRDRRDGALAVDTGTETPAIITEYDIVSAFASGSSVEGQTVADHLTHVVVAASPDWSLGRAVSTMIAGGFRHLLIVDGELTLGMLTMRDIMATLTDPHDQHEPVGDTVDFGAIDDQAAGRLLHTFRRNAKQHMVAAKCFCELDWLEVLVGQTEERPEIGTEELQSLWDHRQPCPILHAEGGGAD